MSDSLDGDQDPIEENWLNGWEQQTLLDWKNEYSTMDERYTLEYERGAQRMWQSFQNSASSIARLYKDGCRPPSPNNRVALWCPFQRSASSVTSQYQDGIELMKQCFDMGRRCGHNRRTEEIITWVKKHRKHIRREEVIGFLCNKHPPPRTKPSATVTRTNSRLSDRSSPRPTARQSPRLAPGNIVEPDLSTFTHALEIQGLNGAMSNIGLYANGNATAAEGSDPNRDDIHGFILEEMSRRSDSSRKRPNSGDNNIGMDSPSRKRNRLM